MDLFKLIQDMLKDFEKWYKKAFDSILDYTSKEQ